MNSNIPLPVEYRQVDGFVAGGQAGRSPHLSCDNGTLTNPRRQKEENGQVIFGRVPNVNNGQEGR
jgi:hypothetical protein